MDEMDETDESDESDARCPHESAGYGDIPGVQLAISLGNDVNEVDEYDGMMALHNAALNVIESLDIIRFLVEQCFADVNIRNYFGQTILHGATAKNFCTERRWRSLDSSQKTATLT